MVHKTAPKDFSPRFEVVSCYFEYGGKILLLHRHNEKSQGGKWGVPAGKWEKAGESAIEAMAREAREETGIELKLSEFDYLDTVFVRYSDYDFVYHMFKVSLATEPKVRLSIKEHKDFRWVAPNEALKMSLVDDLDKCIMMSYQLLG